MPRDLVAGTVMADAHPLGMVIGGWKPRSPGVPPWRDFPHHALVLTVAGSARYADARGTEATLRPGDVLVVHAGLRHWFLPERSGWDEYFLIFSGPSFAPWIGPGMLVPERPVLALGEVAYWLQRFAAVLGDAPVRPLDAAVRMHGLLAEIAQAAPLAQPAAEAAWLARARALLGDVEGRPSLALVANRLGCSHQVFRKRFRQLSGESPGVYRERMRLEESCRLLARMRVAEVAERLGFCDQFQFSRRFRQRFGVPPRQFQRL